MLNNSQEADNTLRRIGHLQRDIKSEEVLLNDAVERLKKEAERKVIPLQDELHVAESILLRWVKENTRDFAAAPTKSRELTYGTVGVKDFPPVPTFMRGYHEADVAKALLKAGVTQCVKVSYKWIKNAVKNLPWPEERFAKFGIKIMQKRNQPFYTINEQKIAEEG